MSERKLSPLEDLFAGDTGMRFAAHDGKRPYRYEPKRDLPEVIYKRIDSVKDMTPPGQSERHRSTS